MIKSIQNLARLDTWLFLHIFDHTSRRFAKRFFYAISRVADGYAYAVIALILFFADTHHGARFLAAGAIAYALETILYLTIKKSIKRKRPFESIKGINFLIQPPDKFSFPSGHTAAAFLFAILVGTFYPTFGAPLLIIATLVGFSRIYLGVHYPGDVLAGSLLGVLCAKIGLFLIL